MKNDTRVDFIKYIKKFNDSDIVLIQKFKG